LSWKQVLDRANRIPVLLVPPVRLGEMVMGHSLRLMPLAREPCRCPNRLPTKWPKLTELHPVLTVVQVLALAQEPGAAQGLVPEVDQVEEPELADQVVELAKGPVLVVVAQALAVVLVWQVLQHRRNASMARQ
jgi:hypothetical protein